MMQFSIKKQHGAVLAFCLVMLLLLTLAGTRMIQQNKQQLEMANNVRLLTQEFANAEGLLAEAKNEIDKQRKDPTFSPEEEIKYKRDPNHRCMPTLGYNQNILLAGATAFKDNPKLNTADVTIRQARCKDNNSFTVCSSYDDTTKKVTCNTIDGIKTEADGCVGDLDNIASLFTSSGNVCYQHYDPIGVNTPDGVPYTSKKCPIEVYTIRVVSKNANGTLREIISDYEANCDFQD